jgi:hypothetical protein
MTRLTLILAALALSACVSAHANSGKTLTLTIPAGQPFATSTAHPLFTACGGPVGDASRVKQDNGDTVWTFSCR